MAVVLFLALGATPGEAQIIPFPTPLIPGLIGPPPTQAPAPAAPPAVASPAKAPQAPAGKGAKASSLATKKTAVGKSVATTSASSASASSAREPSFARTGPGSTTGLIAGIAPLVANGMSSREALILAGPPFPVAGMAKFSDDFLTPRLTPFPHLHQGTDIFADFGTPIVASGPGKVTQRDNAPGAGGLEMWVAGDDGVNYYYAHLLAFADAANVGRPVTAGTVLGYVGNTGDASGGPPHLHFEIHPGSARDQLLAAGVPIAGIPASASGSVNPKPILDAWLATAELHALAMGEKSSATPGTVEPPVDLSLAGRTGRPAEWVWFSVFQPSLGSLGLALQAAATAPDVDRAASSALDAAEIQRRAEVDLAVRTPYVHLGELAGNGSDSPMDQLLDLSSPH